MSLLPSVSPFRWRIASPWRWVGASATTRKRERTSSSCPWPRLIDRSDWDLDLPDVVIDPTAGRPTKDAIAGLLAARGPEMVYQPIVDLRGANGAEVRTAGYESLARFPFATPPEWFEVASGVGLRTELELAAIRNAIIGFSPDGDEFLGMNISDATLVSSSLATALDGIDPGRVVLELSEETLITSYEETRRSVDALRERGVRLAVDDVGSGEIDLWHILSLEPGFIKIDMTFGPGHRTDSAQPGTDPWAVHHGQGPRGPGGGGRDRNRRRARSASRAWSRVRSGLFVRSSPRPAVEDQGSHRRLSPRSAHPGIDHCLPVPTPSRIT